MTAALHSARTCFTGETALHALIALDIMEAIAGGCKQSSRQTHFCHKNMLCNSLAHQGLVFSMVMCISIPRRE